MDKVDKSLLKITPKQRVKILETLKKIKSGELENLDLKKLRGTKDIFRIRVGNYRIIFVFDSDAKARIIAIERRSKNTYKDF
jgi:mRNA interferase RelE/StbE